jgi:hypothetical protein
MPSSLSSLFSTNGRPQDIELRNKFSRLAVEVGASKAGRAQIRTCAKQDVRKAGRA